MGLKEIKDAVDRAHPDWKGKQRIALIKELRDQERIEEKAGRPFSVEQALGGHADLSDREVDQPAQEAAAAEPQEEQPASAGGAVLTLVLVVAVPRLIGLGIWGSVFNDPGWWDVMSAVLIVAGISGVVSAVRGRSSAGAPPSA
jgi:hypothetical protein